MPIRHVVLALVTVVIASASAGAQHGYLQRLSPEAIENLIASAAPDTPAAVIVANRRITTLRAAVLDRSSATRAAAVREVIAALTVDGAALTASSRALGSGAVISAGDRDVFAIVPADADELIGETVEAKAAIAVAQLQQALDEIAESQRPRVLAWAATQSSFVTALFVVALIVLTRANNWITAAAGRATERHLSKLKVVGDEIARQTRLLQYVHRSASLALLAAGAVLAYLWLTFVLRRFPYTRPWGESLRALLVDRGILFAERAVAAVPDLLTIALIALLARFAMRVLSLIFAAVEDGRLTVMWVYPETAAMTRKLSVALVWLFALVAAYPYVPGSDTDAFKGVSVFVGLMVSLGSSGLVNQVMSGFTLTYSRALRRGDLVRVGDIEGTVTYLGMLSAKIDTLRREEVTIPNAVMVAQCVTNYSRHSTDGVFAATEVTIGYDAPWRKVEALLLRAAAITEGVRREPAPFVLQKSLEDFYVRYALMVSVDDATRRAQILDRLHANIQDAFNEEGVQIMSPNYEADPGEPKLVPKERWYK